MRSAALRSAVAALGALAVAAIAPPVIAQETPKRGGILRHVVEQEGNTLDCHGTATSFSLQILAPHYNTLLRIDPDDFGRVIGDLAESWTISDDGLTYSFTLREGVRFHDGSTLDSADIKATYERLRAPPEGVTSSRQGLYAGIDRIETPDARTVVFTLKRPDPAMLITFANPWACVYSAEKLAENPTYPATEVMGTGPFVFVEHVPGSHWDAARFEDYWDTGRPYLDGIRANFISGAGVVNAIAGNQVDATFFLVAPADQQRLTAMNPDIVIESGPFNVVNFLTFNLTRPPFDRVEVRRAFNLALSRYEGDAILPQIAALKGFGLYMPPNSIAERTLEELQQLPGFNPDVAAQRAEAIRMLEEAGVAGMSVTLLNRNLRQPWEPLGIFVLDQWRQVGLNADQIAAETPQYFAALTGKTYDIAIDFNNTVSVDPNEVLVKFLPGSPNNYSGLEDPKLLEMFEAQARATGAERAQIVRDIEAYMLDQAYYIPMFRSTRAVAYHRDVKGWKLPPTTTLNLSHDRTWLDR